MSTRPKAWHNNRYIFLPPAQEIEEYRRLLYDTYKEYEGGDSLALNYFSDYLSNDSIKCSSENTKCNDRRSMWLHRTNTALIVTAIVALCAFLAFFFGGLDKANIKKVTAVSIINPITLTGGPMSDQPTIDQQPQATVPTQRTPPPPPPPPPLRLIREGVSVGTTRQVVPSEGKRDGK